MGFSPKKEGPPPNPMITMIAVIRAALDRQGGSLSRLQARGHIRIGRKAGTNAEGERTVSNCLLATRLGVATTHEGGHFQS